MKNFRELRVIEIAGSSAGGYAGKLFADWGADVLLIEPSEGAPGRSEEPAWEGVGTRFAYLNTSKQSLALDLAMESGREKLARLLEGADVVIESSAPGPLNSGSTQERDRHVFARASLRLPQSRSCSAAVSNPGLIRVLISPFGPLGPYANYRSNEFTDQAIGGHLYLNGEPDREPIQRPGMHSLYQAGAHAFIGAMAALIARERAGMGQEVRVSHLEGFAALHQHTTVMFTQGGHVINRVGNGQPGPWHPVGVYPCKGGFVALAIPSTAMLGPMLKAAGLGDLLADPRFCDDFVRGEHKREFDLAIAPWLQSHSAAQIIAMGQGVSAPVGPVPAMTEMVADRHLQALKTWRALGRERPLHFPRGGIRLEGREPEIRMAPSLGSARGWRLDNETDVRKDLGKERAGEKGDQSSLAEGPLAGVRILDLTRVWAGPLAARMLGDLGADVIRIEASWARGLRTLPPEAAERSHLYPDNELGERHWNRNAGFNKLNRNKRGLTLELNLPRGREVFEALVSRSDVVIENFSPRVMPKLGLDYTSLSRINPHLIYVAMPGFGSTGPNRDRLAFGPLIEAASGLTSTMGYADSGPYRSGVAWPDPVTALQAVAGVLLAYYDRESDPERKGRRVETPMIEAMLAFVGEELLAAQLRGQDEPRRGNRHPARAPQGVYPCAGEDRWIAISVTGEQEWFALCDEAGLDDSLRTMDLAARLEHHDAIDEALSTWTRKSEPTGLMARLQSMGVIACIVADARDIVNDPQLEADGFWAEVDHAEVGLRRYPGLPIHLDRTPATFRRGAPLLGEHNTEVLTQILGLSPDEIESLKDDGVISDLPPEDAPLRSRNSA